MTTLTFWQYFKLNKKTTISCLKITSILFAFIASAIAIGVKYTKGAEEDPLTVFLACEAFGYGFAAFIFLLAIFEGYTKAKIVIGQFNKIPEGVRDDYSLKLIERPLNSRYWFKQFMIVQNRGNEYYELDERTKREVLGERH